MTDDSMWSAIFSNHAGEERIPMTSQQFAENTKALLKLYTSGARMTVQPDYYPHLTTCCGRFYQTTGQCWKGGCPYECGKPRAAEEGECPSCTAVKSCLMKMWAEEIGEKE